MPPLDRICPCRSVQSESAEKTYCQACIRLFLTQRIQEHKTALEERNQARESCAQELQELRSLSVQTPHLSKGPTVKASPQQIIDEYQDRIQMLTKDIELLREECGKKSIALASYSVMQSNRALENENSRNIILESRRRLELLRTSILTGNDDEKMEGNLTSTIEDMVIKVRKKRFQLAIDTFDMFRVDVGSEYDALTVDMLMDVNSENDVPKSDCKSNSQPSSSVNPRFLRLVKQRVPSGIGKVAGLLFPHRGPQQCFSGVLPHNVLMSSLRLIASLTNALARCLSIELPHPIVLSPVAKNMDATRFGITHERLWLKDQTADIIDSVPKKDNSKDDGTNPNITSMKDVENLCSKDEQKKDLPADKVKDEQKTNAAVKVSASTSSLMSLVGRSALKALDKVADKVHHSIHIQKSTPTTKKVNAVTLPMDPDSVKLRVQYTTYAIIYESTSTNYGSSTKYKLRPPLPNSDKDLQRQNEEQFTIALQLLQNDIVALCIRAGVPVAMLWPAEAMLLNLHSLRLHIQSNLE